MHREDSPITEEQAIDQTPNPEYAIYKLEIPVIIAVIMDILDNILKFISIANLAFWTWDNEFKMRGIAITLVRSSKIGTL